MLLAQKSIRLLGLIFAIIFFNINCRPLPPATCPNVQPVQAQPNFGPPAAHTGKASIELDFTGNYIGILAMGAGLPTTLSSACGGAICGADIGQIALIQQDPLNLLSVPLAVWMMSSNSSNKVYLPNRNYTLLIQLVPHLISPATIPDPQARQTLLCANASPPCGNFGIVIELAFSNLMKFTAPVDCHGSNYDLIDQQVLTSVLQFFDGYKDSSGQIHPPGNTPIAFSADAALQNIGTLMNKSLSFIGVDLGTDGNLEVGLLLGDSTGMQIGSPLPFDPHSVPLIGMHPPVLAYQDDWDVLIDSGLMSSAISAFATMAATTPPNGDPKVTVTAASVSFSGTSGQEIDVNLSAKKKIDPCGTVSFAATAKIMPSICSCGSSVNANLRMCIPSPSLSCTSDPGTCACVLGVSLVNSVTGFIGQFFTSVVQSFQGGMAFASVGPCPGNKCDVTMLRFTLKTDTLYAVEFGSFPNTAFYLAGRSQLLDSTMPGRGTAPPSCP